tara:strand:- start:4262 stop:7591 length:3330 start_codon:yes stop_codon:yes gene_type:complete
MANNKPIKYTAIPRNNTDKAVSALSTIAETLIGAKGNGLEKAVTFRDLQDLDLVTIRRTLDGRNFIFDPIDPGDNDDPGVETPTAPTNFTATGGFTSVLLRWDFPTYGGHSYTEIWRSETNVLGEAAKLVDTNSLNYSDIPGNNFTGYYWARHVNQNGVEGPFHATSGELGETAEDVEFNIAVLNGRLSEIHLNSYLSGRIDLVQTNNDAIAALDTLVDNNKLAADSAINTINTVTIPNLQSSIQTTTDAIDAKVIDVQTVTIPAINTTINNIETVTIPGINQQITDINNLFPDYATLAYANSTFFDSTEVDSAISGRLDTFLAQVIEPDYVAQAFLTSSYRTEANTDLAITQAIDTHFSTVVQPNYTTQALLTSNYRTEANTDLAITQAIDTHFSTVIQPDFVTQALLTTDYRTEASTDTAITQAINTHFSTVIQPDFVTQATLTTDYRTEANTDAAITQAINTHFSTVIQPDYVSNAFLQTNYYTGATVDGAISDIATTLRSEFNSGNVTTAYLEANYRTEADSNTAIAAAVQVLRAEVDADDYATNATLTTDYRTEVDTDNAISQAISSFLTNTITPNYATTAFLQANYLTETDTDGAISSAITDLMANTIGPTYATNAFITNNYRTETDTDSAIATELSSFLSTTIAPTYATNAFITDNYRTETNTDTAIATQVSGLRSEIFSGAGTTLQSAFVSNLDSAISNANGSIAQSLSGLSAAINDPVTGLAAQAATISNNYQAVVNDEGDIISSHIAAYSVTANGVTNTLSQWAEVAADVDANFTAQWGFKATVGELTGGVGFVNNGGVTQFTVQADRFAIIDPRNDQVKSLFATVVNDPVLPDGVYIDTAFIKAATIAELVAGEINADTVTAGISIDTPILNGGTINGGVIKSPTFEMIGTNFMEVKMVQGFGGEGLYYWFGPRIVDVNGNPNYAALTKANAIEWKDTAGNAYFGGTLSAGVLKNAARSTTLVPFPSVSIGPFTTNGNLKQIAVSISWSGSFSGTGATPTNPTQPSAVLTLERSTNGSSWSFLTNFSASGTTIIEEFFEPGGPDYISFENLSETGFTYTDNTPGVANVYYRVRVSSQVRYHATQNINNQVLSLISTEA